MRTLYFDCFSGASGNMVLGALVGLGVDARELERQVAKMKIAGISLDVRTVDRSGISATHVEVNAPEQSSHRHLSDIISIIGGSDLNVAIKERAVAIFTRLAEAEAAVHGITVEKVHFHEVGAVDAIVDIVGACIGFDILGIERFACSKIHVGSGFVEMEHGRFPVPPPAVAELLRDAPIYSTALEGELITPTGAAIISTLCDSYGPLPEVRLEAVAYGAGTRSYERFPNVLRLVLGETQAADGFATTRTDRLVLLETNMDDQSPQVTGYIMERAFELGALDCWFTPIQMKKNRPASMLSILCAKEKRELLAEMIYSESTSLGLRFREVERECLDRQIVAVSTRFGKVDVKLAYYDGRVVNAMPEFDQVRAIAVENDLPVKEVHDEVLGELRRSRHASTA